MISKTSKPVNIVQSPPSWHVHKTDPLDWFESAKDELVAIERQVSVYGVRFRD